MRFRSARRDSRAAAVRALRVAVDRLPLVTREAMLEGIRDERRIIAGGYSDGRGGVCPILAAHRRGCRSPGAEFARAWDRFAGATRGMRPATPEQLHRLETIVWASIHAESMVPTRFATRLEQLTPQVDPCSDTRPGEIDLAAILRTLGPSPERA